MVFYIVDAFTDEQFKGNPAGVCILEKPLNPDTMQKIAAEINLSETAFIEKAGDIYNLRWFTPTFEIDLCGHATLASAFVITEFIKKDITRIRFSTKSGILEVKKNNSLFDMNFPVRKFETTDISERIINTTVLKPKEAYSCRDLYLVLDSEDQVSNYKPDYDALLSLSEWMGIVITAKGNDCDFVSRFFMPEIFKEDPVTGSTHSCLIPYWAEKLNKKIMTARQLSDRGGTLQCELLSDRVKISGNCVLFMKGEIII